MGGVLCKHSVMVIKSFVSINCPRLILMSVKRMKIFKPENRKKAINVGLKKKVLDL